MKKKKQQSNPNPQELKKEDIEKELKEMEKSINENEIENNITNETNMETSKESKDQEVEPSTSNNKNKTTITSDGRYCYIGVNKGYRSCIELSESDKCMSGEIFPSMDICMNPNLRLMNHIFISSIESTLLHELPSPFVNIRLLLTFVKFFEFLLYEELNSKFLRAT